MRKPTIPHHKEENTNSGFPEPTGSPLTLEDEDVFAKPLEAPILGASSVPTDIKNEIKCLTCKHGWHMTLAGRIKNRKEDGTAYTQQESYCTFEKQLVSLAERLVINCSRYEEK